MNAENLKLSGIGMTSQRTRDRLIQRLRDQGIESETVLKVMSEVPRHLFVDEALAHRAYEDTALPIGHSQTISQPYIVACMTQCLFESGSVDSVLEIGTGCGYQTAVLSCLFPHVYSVERIRALHLQAVEKMAQLKIYNTHLRHADGNFGWPLNNSQFDRIIITAACTEIPKKIQQQLKPGGLMVLPLDDGVNQTLMQVRKTAEGIESEKLEKVIFVPLLKGLS